MASNGERLRSEYNVEEPLEGLIERLNKCTEFALIASEPVSDTHIVRIAYVLVVEMGQYPKDFRAWRTQ